MLYRSPTLDYNQDMRRFKLWAGLLLFLALLAAGGLIWLFRDLPSVDSASFGLNLPSIRITDRQGRLLYELLAPGGDGGRNAPTPIERIPLVLRQATIATEDASFYTNPGVDPLGIVRALWINLQGGETLSGGSTITQQVARGQLMSPQERLQRTLRRKLRESILAWQLTQRYSKDEILGFYLNQTYYGGMAYGVEAAAQTYFGKSASQLDLAESALLAGLPQAPALYNPFTDMAAAKKRQAVVLGLMQKAGYLDGDQVALAEREPLVLAGTPYPLEAPHFVMMVRSQIDALFTPDQVMAYGGLVVRTTLDLDDQKKAEQAVADQLERLHSKESGTAGHNLNDAAVVALDPHTGQILAMVGSADYNDQAHAGAVNMALAPRQPGSALKPFIYASAFDPARPKPWTAASMLLDVSTHFVTHDQQPYTPVNYDGQEHGPVLARDALASSLNIPAVLTLDHIGLPALFDLAGRLGMATPSGRPGPFRPVAGPGRRRRAPARPGGGLRGAGQRRLPGRPAGDSGSAHYRRPGSIQRPRLAGAARVGRACGLAGQRHPFRRQRPPAGLSAQQRAAPGPPGGGQDRHDQRFSR